MIFIDPGGYVEIYVSRNYLSGIQISDLQFLLLMIPLFSPRIKFSIFFQNRINLWIILFLTFFTIFYHILVYGVFSNSGTISDLSSLLKFQRLTLVAYVVIIPAYIFFLRSYIFFFKFSLYTSLLFSIFYLISLFADVGLMTLLRFERNRGDGGLRIAVLSYGYSQIFLYLLYIKYVFNLYLPQFIFIIFIAITILLAEVLTLTRRTVFNILAQFLIIYLIFNNFNSRFIARKFL